MIDLLHGPAYFVEYCKRWEEAAKNNGNTIVNSDLYQIVMWYKRLYDSDKPNLEEIDELLEFLDVSVVGSIETHLRGSIFYWRESLIKEK